MSKAPTLLLKKIETFPMKVEVAIPPENPIMRGHVTVHCKVKTKAEVKDLRERELEDKEYFEEVATGVSGLSAPDSDEALEGMEAITEFTEGRYSLYLLNAFVEQYFEQYSDARRKNSKTRR